MSVEYDLLKAMAKASDGNTFYLAVERVLFKAGAPRIAEILQVNDRIVKDIHLNPATHLHSQYRDNK